MLRCCICGKEIKDPVHDGNNPDPLKDENGKFLSEGEDPFCCKDCDTIYVLSVRMAQYYGVPNQVELTQKKVLELRKKWRK